MIELNAARKNKVNLSDYNVQLDIQNRRFMADFSSFDLEVLEEILFSPLKVSIKKLSKNLSSSEKDLSPILEKLSTSGLFSIESDFLLVDKEMRKYFEFQLTRFSPGFKPDMEYLQGILKKVPIHLLPTWYAIPRTSNNIFESLVEKYFVTPQAYQRYLNELNFNDFVLDGIVRDLFSSKDLLLSSSDVISKYNLSREDFEEKLLFLEFNFVCFLSYEKEDDHWSEWITPLQEWKDYQQFIQKTKTPFLEKEEAVYENAPSVFFFIEKMSEILSKTIKTPLKLNLEGIDPLLLSEKDVDTLLKLLEDPFLQKMSKDLVKRSLSRVFEKMVLLRLGKIEEKTFFPLEEGKDWLNLSYADRALYLHRHPLNKLLGFSDSEIVSDRNVREAEKAVKRVLHGNWVLFDEFLKGVLASIGPGSSIKLEKMGRQWKYSLPCYSDEDKTFLKSVIFDWLFEVGMIKTGTFEGKDCFCVTPLGRSFFAD